MNTIENFFERNRKFKIIILGVILVGIFFVNQFYFIVQPGEKGMIIRLGQLQESIYDDGLHLKLPFVDKAITTNIQTQKIEKQTTSASKDLQTVYTTLVLNYRLTETQVLELYKNIGERYVIENKIIQPAIEESVKAASAQFDAEKLITQRQKVSQAIKENLIEKLEKVGITVVDINIVDFQFSEEFDKAIEEKVKAEQEALAEKNRLEQIKYQAQQKIEQAKGEKEAKILKAQGDAESIRIQSEAIKAQGGAQYVQLKWIEQRDGVLPKTNLGGDTPVIMNLGE